jgi:hypothetical protein
LQRCAGAAEQALIEGLDAGPALQATAQALAQLRAAAQAPLAEQRAAAASAPPGGAEPIALAQSDLEGLAALLRQQDMAALERFEQLSPALRQVLGDASFGRLSEAVQTLDFAAALALLPPPG